jgi:hypothetical protein
LAIYPVLVGGLEHEFYVSRYWEFHHPTDEVIFFRGVGIPPTSVKYAHEYPIQLSSIYQFHPAALYARMIIPNQILV